MLGKTSTITALRSFRNVDFIFQLNDAAFVNKILKYHSHIKNRTCIYAAINNSTHTVRELNPYSLFDSHNCLLNTARMILL